MMNTCVFGCEVSDGLEIRAPLAGLFSSPSYSGRQALSVGAATIHILITYHSVCRECVSCYGACQRTKYP